MHLATKHTEIRLSKPMSSMQSSEVFRISFPCASHLSAALCRFPLCVLVLLNADIQSIATHFALVKSYLLTKQLS